MKRYFIITLTLIGCLINNSITAQNNKTLIFSGQNNTPMEDVQVWSNKNFIAISSLDGKCEIPDNITQIQCIYMGFKDTIVNIGNNKTYNIKLNGNAILLNEVVVTAKYDISNHLFNLWEKNCKKRNIKDTIVYYSFSVEYEIPELNQKEIMQGVIKQIYKKGQKLPAIFDDDALICKVDFYYSNIEDKDKEIRPIVQFNPKLYNIDFMNLVMKEKKKMKKEIETLYRNKDSIIFKVKYFEQKAERAKINQYYYGFKNDNMFLIETSREEIPHMIGYGESTSKYLHGKHATIDRAYESVELNSKTIIYPKSISALYEYYNKKDENKPIKMIKREYLKTIPNPNLEFELNISPNGNLIDFIERIKTKYPDYIIPNK